MLNKLTPHFQLPKLASKSTSTANLAWIMILRHGAARSSSIKKLTERLRRNWASKLLLSPLVLSLKLFVTQSSVCFFLAEYMRTIYGKGADQESSWPNRAGVDGDDWEIPGDGNYPFAITSRRDIGLYTTRAVVLAYNDPASVPSRLRVYSETKYVL